MVLLLAHDLPIGMRPIILDSLVCSAVTHRVILIEAKIVNGHEHL